MLRRGHLALFAGAFLAVGAFAAVAPAALTRSEIKVVVAPAKQSAKTPGGVSIRVDSETAYDSYAPPPNSPSSHVIRTVLHLDDDFSFNTGTYPRCDRADIATANTDAAKTACPGSEIGSGSATVDGVVGPADAVVTAFNGEPQNGLPTVLFHSRAGAPLNSTTVLVGVLEPSERGGDFGKQLDITVDPIGGGYEVIKHFDVTVGKIVTKKANKKKRKPAKFYVAARCRDKDRTWNFSGDSTFQNNGAPGSFQTVAPATQKCVAKKSKKKKKK
jgi:hypothetical protein